MDFDDCYKRKYVHDNDLLINFISKEDLLKNKKLTGRLKDFDDVNQLSKI